LVWEFFELSQVEALLGNAPHPMCPTSRSPQL
jgi:hypothetical protein